MIFPSSSEMEMGNKRNKSKNGRKCTSDFYNCCCETCISNLINSYQFIVVKCFIQNLEKSLIFFLKNEFLDEHILIVDKLAKSDGILEVFWKGRLSFNKLPLKLNSRTNWVRRCRIHINPWRINCCSRYVSVFFISLSRNSVQISQC